jgi:membrane protein DedA with SNARE-associated domain
MSCKILWKNIGALFREMEDTTFIVSNVIMLGALGVGLLLGASGYFAAEIPDKFKLYIVANVIYVIAGICFLVSLIRAFILLRYKKMEDAFNSDTNNKEE